MMDRIARALGATASRRAGIAAVLGLAAGGAAAVAPDAAAGADRRRKRRRPGAEGPCGDGSRRDNACSKDKDCCTGICKTGLKNNDGKGRCRCVKKGKACTEDRNCCGGRTCADGICGGNPAPPPPPTCDATTCPAGCCDGQLCVTVGTTATCGTGGGACVTCPGETPVCCAGACAAGTWGISSSFGAGTSGSGADQFDGAFTILVSPDQATAWISDTGNNRISIWTQSGGVWSPSETVGSGPGSGANQLQSPNGIAVSPDGSKIWIADNTNNRVSIWTKTGGVWSNLTTFGSGSGSGASQFNAPSGLAVSADGTTVWVSDTFNYRISIWTESGGVWSNQGTFGDSDDFNRPAGLFVSADGSTAYIADKNNNRISIWQQSGGNWLPLTTFGVYGSGQGQLDAPFGVVASPDGNTVYVADTSNDRVSVWRKDGGGTWGNIALFGSDGSDPNQMSDPFGLAVTSDGTRVYVADSFNYRTDIWELVCPD